DLGVRYLDVMEDPAVRLTICLAALRRYFAPPDRISFRSSVRPEMSIVGVAPGPHPPPPVASTKPAIRPRGDRKRALNPRCSRSRRVPLSANLTRRVTPRAKRMPAIQGRATSVERLESTDAPR